MFIGSCRVDSCNVQKYSHGAGRIDEEDGDSEAEVEHLVDEGEELEGEEEMDMARFLRWFGMNIGGGRMNDKTQRARDAATRADK